MFVPVVDQNQKPLMPTKPSRARRWIESGRATPFFKGGIFCVRLNHDVQTQTQPIACGVDSGSKREAFTLKSTAHTYLNVPSHAVDWVKKALKTRREMRRGRRFRKTPYRKCRPNRRRNPGPHPATKARWQAKLRLINIFRKVFPITDYAVEDIKARTVKGKCSKNKAFSQLEVGKSWFYGKVENLGKLKLYSGKKTAALRKKWGLPKSKKKLSDDFYAHCVDTWVLANDVVSGHEGPDNTCMLKAIPLRFHRRQLHRLKPRRGARRSGYGGTRSLGFKRGSIVKHKKYGKCYVGGSSMGRLSLHGLESGVRLCQNGKVEDVLFKSYSSWRWQLLPGLKSGVSAAS